MTVTIGGLDIGHEHHCRVIAEIGVNHNGDIDRALDLIAAARRAGCDAVKFQKRTPHLAVPEAEWGELRDTPFGKMPKLDYRERVEFDWPDYQIIAEYCQTIGIPWFVSVWDLPSVEIMEGMECVAYKIPSARLHDTALLRRVARTMKPLILSTGMSTMEDVETAVRTLDNTRQDKTPCFYQDLILLQCTSAYPAKAEESNLRVIQTYRETYCDMPVGFSSHKIGLQTCLLAVAAGACVIERHITLDRAALGSDHKMSSTPEDLARLVKEIRYAEQCLGDGVKRVYPSEEGERKRLRGHLGMAQG